MMIDWRNRGQDGTGEALVAIREKTCGTDQPVALVRGHVYKSSTDFVLKSNVAQKLNN